MSPSASGWDLPWLIAALAAQVLLAICLLIHWRRSTAGETPRTPTFVICLALIANGLLLAYAWREGQPVFVVGQGFILIVVLRAAGMLLGKKEPPPVGPPRSFPVVAPDSAEWKRIPPAAKPPIADAEISPPIG